MSFLSAILIFFLIVWLLGQLLRRYMPQIMLWLFKRRMRSQMHDFQSRQQSQRYGSRQGQQRRQAQSQRRRRSKIFDSSVGEYVEFEEIKVYSSGSDSGAPADFKPEPQISDAEWEEIK